ncbi:MAG TPA: hypothetical protein VM683_03750 [Anaeromyxobacteraceae bacterium]|nr:hypothetical protein [Anaeromyxobacteraceae bacterium]
MEELHEAAEDLADVGVSEEEFVSLARQAFEDVVAEREAARPSSATEGAGDYSI